jgi:tetratricopeptide (TPR) repeat protein
MKPPPNSTHPFCAVGVLLVAVVLAGAQTGRPQTDVSRDDKTGKGSIRGRVLLPSGAFVGESLKATLLTVNGPQSTVYTDSQGSFEFPDLVPGNYEVQIETNGQQYDVVSQSVQVFRGAPSIITITLRDKNSGTRTDNKSVTVAELADVPKAAKKEFDLATKAAADKRGDEAVIHLRKAIAIYPNFVMARNDLGAQLLAQGKLDEAVEELRQAILIDPKAFNPKLNLGIVFVQQHQFSEAADVLGRASALDAQSPAARLYYGLALMGSGNFTDAETQLKAAYSLGGASYSLAVFHLGQLYMNRGDSAQARDAFERYLHDSPQATNADQVRRLIAMLR